MPRVRGYPGRPGRTGGSSADARCAAVRLLREELQLLQEPGSYVGEVVKVMGKQKVLVKVRDAAPVCGVRAGVRTRADGDGRHAWAHDVQVHPDGKYVVDIDKSIDITKVTPNLRVSLRSDSYQLHRILPNKVDPLVSLMMVEKVRAARRRWPWPGVHISRAARHRFPIRPTKWWAVLTSRLRRSRR